MTYSRRDFLRTGSAAAVGLAGFPPVVFPSPAAAEGTPPARLPTPGDPNLREIAMKALDAAQSAGARYADVRITTGKTRDTIMLDREVFRNRWTVELQFGVRVLVDGAWGFASTTRDVSVDRAAVVARLAVEQAKANPFAERRLIEMAPAPVVADGRWKTPIDQDPFSGTTAQDQLALQLAANEAILDQRDGGPEELAASSRFLFNRTDYTFLSSEGSNIFQSFTSFGGQYLAYVISEDRQYGHGIQPASFRGGGYGWEAIDGIPFAQDAAEAVANARAMARAKVVDVGRYDVVLDSGITGPMLHGSVVQALEYDRVIGYEMNSGGTSYLSPPEQTLGQFDFKNELMNVRCTSKLPKAPGAYKWDMEGVEAQDFDLIKGGVVVDYLTTREFAPGLEWWYRRNGLPIRSRGCAGSAGSGLVQLVAPGTTVLDPAGDDVTIDDMVAETEDGILFEGGGFLSMDPPLANLQFSASSAMVREIKDGKRGDLVKYTGIQGQTRDLWRSIDMLGGGSTVGESGVTVAKGAPTQLFPRAVTAPAVRIKQVNVVNYGRRG